MAESGLLPCPFCGGAGELKDSFVRTKGGCSGYRRGWVGCSRCGVYMQWSHAPGGAVKKWNTRTAGEAET